MGRCRVYADYAVYVLIATAVSMQGLSSIIGWSTSQMKEKVNVAVDIDIDILFAFHKSK